MGKKFSELERAVSLNDRDLAAFAQVDQSAATGYKSKAAPMSLVSQKILKDTEYASDLQTDEKNVLGAINEVYGNTIAEDVVSGPVAKFTTSLRKPLKSWEANFMPRRDSGTPTPQSPLTISGWSSIKLTNCGSNMVNISPFSEWEIARSDFYILRFSVPKTIINVSLIDKDPTVDLTGVAFGFVDSNWDKTKSLTTNDYRWFIQNGSPQTTKKNISIADTTKILTGLIFSPQNEATLNKLLARYYFEFEYEEVSTYEPFNGNIEPISLGGSYYGGKVTQDENGNRKLTVDMEKDTMSSSYLSGLSSSYIGYVASVPAMNNHPCIWVRNWKYPPDAKGRVYGGIKALCNAFAISMNDASIISTQNRVYFDVDGMGITDAAGFISAVEAMEQNGKNLEICYELETPYVIDLSDGESIVTLSGLNNIYSDGGDTSVEYALTIKEYIDNKIASVQALILNS